MPKTLWAIRLLPEPGKTKPSRIFATMARPFGPLVGASLGWKVTFIAPLQFFGASLRSPYALVPSPLGCFAPALCGPSLFWVRIGGGFEGGWSIFSLASQRNYAKSVR